MHFKAIKVSHTGLVQCGNPQSNFLDLEKVWKMKFYSRKIMERCPSCLVTEIYINFQQSIRDCNLLGTDCRSLWLTLS